MNKFIFLFLLFTLFFNKSYGSEEECIVKNIDNSHLEEDCQADEIIEVWCTDKESQELKLMSQCFAYYQEESVTAEGYDSKVKCVYY